MSLTDRLQRGSREGVGGPGKAGRGDAPPHGTEGSGESFGRGARILSIGIASTGLFTFAYLATSSHVLDPASYSRISLCWAIMFVILSVIYRPIEQLLSRMIADRRARGLHSHPLRVPATIQLGFALLFLAVALVLRSKIQQGMFGGSSALYWILLIGVLAYAGSYFARGWLAGHKRFDLYGALVFLEATSRFIPAVVVAVGLASGQGAVGLGMVIAPFASLSVMPFAFSRLRPGAPAGIPVADAAGEGPAHAGLEEAAADLSLAHGADFAISVVGVMLSEQTLMNAGVLIVAARTSGATLTSGLVGFVFNVMLIVRAPLQLFQAIQTSILPHLTGLDARENADEFGRAVRITVLAIAGFGLAVALGLLAIGPPVMQIVLGNKGGGLHYARLGLAIVGVGMGLHLVSGTLNQAALARGRARAAAAAWLISAALFVVFMLTGSAEGNAAVTRVELGYFGATAVLCVLLSLVYRLGPRQNIARPAQH
ncbi:MAG: lipopolysaccharide biosynthesis protein [Solirubrobacteraceae bacterium]